MYSQYVARLGLAVAVFHDVLMQDLTPSFFAIWPGQPISAHWGFEDPAAAQGTDEDKRRVFEKVCRQIMSRVHVFLGLPLPLLEKSAIQHEMKAIGETQVVG